MTDREEEARLRAEEHHTEFAIRRDEQAMANEAQRLAHEMEELSQDQERAEREIEEELRTEHWGKEPERPLGWTRDARNRSRERE